MEAAMNNAADGGQPTAGGAGPPGLPPVAGRAAFQAELDKLRVREKAHTREGDAIAAARPPDWPPVPAWPGGRPIAQWPRLVSGRSDDLGSN